MVAIAGSVFNLPGQYDRGTHVITWTPLTEADTATAVSFAASADRSVQVTGAFGAATVILEGSNDGTTFFPLNDPFGTAISFTAAGGAGVAEATRFVRPSASGGTGQSLTIRLFVRRIRG
jgi:hypothetical protein